jgi:hypothetical protein
VLDGRDTLDYCQRVEPSDQGGRKMAESFLAVLNGDTSLTHGMAMLLHFLSPFISAFILRTKLFLFLFMFVCLFVCLFFFFC